MKRSSFQREWHSFLSNPQNTAQVFWGKTSSNQWLSYTTSSPLCKEENPFKKVIYVESLFLSSPWHVSCLVLLKIDLYLHALATQVVHTLFSVANNSCELIGQACPKTSFFLKLKERCSSPTYSSHRVNKTDIAYMLSPSQVF